MSDSGERIGKRKFEFHWSANMNVLVIWVAFVLIITLVQVFSLTPGKFPTMIAPANLANVLSQVSATGIMAMGMALIMIAGGIDLSVGMLTSFVVLYAAKSYTDYGLSLQAALITAVIFAIAFEAGMGFIVSRLNVEPFIITLGGMICFRGVALLVVHSQEISMKGAMDPLKTSVITGVKDPAGLVVNVPPYIFIFIAITVIIWIVMRFSKYGRRIYAVGANKNAAYLAGIDVKNIIFSTYILNGLLVAVASLCLLARVNTAIITVGQNKEIDVIASAVIGGVALSGGKGSIWGVFIGAILMGAIENGMNILRLNAEWQYVAKGLIIIGAVSAAAIVANMQAKRQLRIKQDASTLATAAIDKAAG
ncbi:MAG: ABC transporter permease [Clostridiales Family XIII bacterium]|jgi:ribose/xylose/arabinose/galactoside ABC-type transport system permease subunit|nr:ABC transporter permease [Clostridiales Family XIII bacterium]